MSRIRIVGTKAGGASGGSFALCQARLLLLLLVMMMGMDQGLVGDPLLRTCLLVVVMRLVQPKLSLWGS